MVDDMHKHKIDIADEIFVIDVGGYISECTCKGIAYAKSQGIVVRYLESTHSRDIAYYFAENV